MNPSDIVPPSGWIRLYRKLLDHWLWTQPRRFSYAEAWLDLLMLASYKEHPVLVGRKVVNVKRGQVLTSQIKLAQCWQWNRKTVSAFLKVLTTDKMTDIEAVKGTDKGYTLITIRNYDKYQGYDDERLDIGWDKALDIGSDIAGTRVGHTQERIRKEKKGKKKKDYRAEVPNGPSAHQEVMDLYHKLFTEKFGKPPLINGGRDGEIIKDLLAKRKDPGEVKELLGLFFKHGTKYVRDNGRYDLAAFRASYNELLVMRGRGDV